MDSTDFTKGDKARITAKHLPECGGVYEVVDYKKPIVFLRVPGKRRNVTPYNEKNVERVKPPAPPTVQSIAP